MTDDRSAFPASCCFSQTFHPQPKQRQTWKHEELQNIEFRFILSKSTEKYIIGRGALNLDDEELISVSFWVRVRVIRPADGSAGANVGCGKILND